MAKKYFNSILGKSFVSEEDYLKAVEEMEKEIGFLKVELQAHKNIIEKKEKEFEEKTNDNKTLSSIICERNQELNKKDEEIERLKEMYKNDIEYHINENKERYKELREKDEKIKNLIKYNNEIIDNNIELRKCVTETGSQNDIIKEELDKMIKEKDLEIERLENDLKSGKNVMEVFTNFKYIEEQHEKAVNINVDLSFENKELKEENKKLRTKETDIISQMGELTRFISNGNKYNKGLVGMRTSDAVKEIIKGFEDHIEVLTKILKEKSEKETTLKATLEMSASKICELQQIIDESGLYKEEEELYILSYIYLVDGIKRAIKLDPQPLEEINELIGMDCDNWFSWTTEKYVKEVR